MPWLVHELHESNENEWILLRVFVASWLTMWLIAGMLLKEVDRSG
jgi:hypothetical protein